MRPLVLTLSVAVLLTGCSGPAPTADHGPATPLPTVDVTTGAPALSPAATSTASSTPSATLTAATRRKPALDGDVDGDGKKDSIRSTATVLTVELSGSGRTVTAAIHAEAPRSAPVLGSTDVDRDGYAEVFVETAQGASTTFVTPYRFDGTTLRELQLDGGPVRLGIGGSITHGDGFRCTSAGLLEIRSADSPDGKAFTVHADLYRLGDTRLVLVRSSTTRAKQGDPAVEQSYNVSCGSVGGGQ